MPFFIWHQQYPPAAGAGDPCVSEHLELPYIVIEAAPAPHGPVAVHVPSYVPLL
jgi:hypothetical protein